jgi:5-methyltetrahydropteroyltriglutamate--homocysteine methyltransferase
MTRSDSIMAVTHTLGFPRIGSKRELKTAVEAFWRGAITQPQLETAGRELRARHWQIQQQAGIDLVPVGDFAWYDQMLSQSFLLGAIPRRFREEGELATLDRYFLLARGDARRPALEMTKWFDTNYHYLVPEFESDMDFRLSTEWLFDEVEEARAMGLHPKPALIGPVTYLYLGKEKTPGFSRLELLPRLLPVYEEILRRLESQGVQWVQMEEPALVLDLPETFLAAYRDTYARLAAVGPKLLLTTYFDSVAERADLVKELPVAGIHLDAVRAPGSLAAFLADFPADRVLSVGIVDGRNVWRTNLVHALDLLEPLREVLQERLWLAPSCSLLHVPIDLAPETELDEELGSWLAFAVQKLDELAILDKGLRLGREAIRKELEENARVMESRRASPRIQDRSVRERLDRLTESDFTRHSPFAERNPLQRQRLRLPLFPTTTIGSFPQTEEIRKARAAFHKEKIDAASYWEQMRAAIREAIRRQEEIGLDLLVHGEPERSDMVEYFAEQLQGFAATRHGWVQSYGSRCVRPPILFGDVSRPCPMTVDWILYAQKQTRKFVKGMLTGPVTLLKWSFVRDDQPLGLTAHQLALAIRDEVNDLEQAGIAAIQIDEPAFREGLPLKTKDRDAYLEWATRAFRLATSGVGDDTQIHSHMCYSEFADILPAIAALDADVLTLETSRSGMDLLEAFRGFRYPNDLGPGVYDIHSPRIPTVEEMVSLLEKALTVIAPERLWVNPDCGLKTRRWEEVDPALRNLVQAARILRERWAKPA